MNRLTLGPVKTTVARVLGICAADAIDYVNRAQERLLYPMKSVGTYGRYRVCVNEACITLPRELETVESVAICNTPGRVRGECAVAWALSRSLLGCGVCVLLNQQRPNIVEYAARKPEHSTWSAVDGDGLLYP